MQRVAERASYEGVILGSSLIDSMIVSTFLIFLMATLPTDWLQMIGTNK